MGLSNYSQRIFRNMGFNERASIDYVDYKQARMQLMSSILILYFFQDDNPVFDLSLMGDHETGVLFTANI